MKSLKTNKKIRTNKLKKRTMFKNKIKIKINKKQMKNYKNKNKINKNKKFKITMNKQKIQMLVMLNNYNDIIFKLFKIKIKPYSFYIYC